MAMDNYISLWNKKFGDDVMNQFISKYHLGIDSHLFKFKPNNLLDKIQCSKDLFDFAEYLEGNFEVKIVSYYSAECNRFYQSKNQQVIEQTDENFEENELFNLIWENVQDISEGIVQIESQMNSIKNGYDSIKKVEKTLAKLNSMKIEKNAKYIQVEELKEMIQNLGNIDDNSTYRRWNSSLKSFADVRIKKYIIVAFFYSLFLLVLGGWLL